MGRPSSRGRWQRVLDARRASRESLGHDPSQGDLFDAPPKKKSGIYVPSQPPSAEPRQDESIHVLTLGEAAARLGLSRGDLERMIAAGRVDTVRAGGLTRMIPTGEVERLRRSEDH